MRKDQIITTGMAVYEELAALERSVDDTMKGFARLIESMITAGTAAQAPIGLGQDALSQMMEGARQMLAVRAAVVDGHATLAKARDQLPFLREMAFGDAAGCPPASAEHRVPALRAV